MKTHNLVHESSVHVSAQGLGNYFWWDLINEYGEWEVYSIFGEWHKTCTSYGEALTYIGYSQ